MTDAEHTAPEYGGPVPIAPEYPGPGEVLIVTGMSGAGRSTAADALEDLGWYVVDNLPPQMLRPLLELTELAGGALPRVAVVVDVRGRELFRELPAITRALRDGRPVRVMFLDASDDVLVRRFDRARDVPGIRPPPSRCTISGEPMTVEPPAMYRARPAQMLKVARVAMKGCGRRPHTSSSPLTRPTVNPVSKVTPIASHAESVSR